MKFFSSFLPASIRMTDLPAAASRPATAQPALPPPTTTYSASLLTLVLTVSSDPFDDRRGCLCATGAHGDECGGAVRALQFVQGGGQQSGAGRADRVAERDRAAADVVLVLGDLVLLRPRHHDAGEGLVDLEDVDVGDRQPAVVERLRSRLHRPVEVVVRVGPDQVA